MTAADNDAERSAAIKAAAKEQYALIGEFAVQFEHVCHSMRSGIVMLMSIGGLRDQTLARAVCAELTAYPLLQAFNSVVLATRAFSDFETKVFGLVHKRVSRLIETRNRLIHGTTFVGSFGSKDTDFSAAFGVKDKNLKSSGVELQHYVVSEASMRPMIDECRTVGDLTQRMWNLLMFPGDGKFEKNFIVADGNVNAMPGLFKFD